MKESRSVRLIRTSEDVTEILDKASVIATMIAAHLDGIIFTPGPADVDIHVIERADGFAITAARRCGDTRPHSFGGRDLRFANTHGREAALIASVQWIAEEVRRLT